MAGNGKYDAAQVAKELDETALGRAFHGNALRVAKDWPGATADDRALLDRYATGRNAAMDHVALQDLAVRLREPAGVELLPLPEWCQGCGESLPRDMQDYARACVEANTEALRAEVARLQEEIANRWAMGVHTCHENCQRTACVLRRDNERLAEALANIIAAGSVSQDLFVAAAKALHPTAAQEDGRE